MFDYLMLFRKGTQASSPELRDWWKLSPKIEIRECFWFILIIFINKKILWQLKIVAFHHQSLSETRIPHGKRPWDCIILIHCLNVCICQYLTLFFHRFVFTAL